MNRYKQYYLILLFVGLISLIYVIYMLHDLDIQMRFSTITLQEDPFLFIFLSLLYLVVPVLTLIVSIIGLFASSYSQSNNKKIDELNEIIKANISEGKDFLDKFKKKP